MGNNKPLLAHLCLFGSGAFWGLMAPVGKDAMTHGIEGIDMVSFRVLGGAILFWLTSLFTRREHIPTTDIIKLAGAGLFGLVFNQCCYTIGLSITSPSNSSIMTTSMPIFAMILSFLILREPITWKKVAGVLLGCSGAVLIIMTSATAGNAKVGNIWATYSAWPHNCRLRSICRSSSPWWESIRSSPSTSGCSPGHRS